MYFDSNMYVSQSELANIFSKRMYWLESNANIPLQEAKINDLMSKYNMVKQWVYERDLAIKAAEYRSMSIDKYGCEYIDVGAIHIPCIEISLNKSETVKTCIILKSVRVSRVRGEAKYFYEFNAHFCLYINCVILTKE